MNIQEAIEKIKELKPDERNLHEYQPEEWDAFEDGFFDAKTYAELIIEELDEPEKVVVPQFVADWYEENKDDFEDKLLYCCDVYCIQGTDFGKWLLDSNNKPIETLVLMHKIGYEVEKEKLYTVKFVTEDFGKIYIGIFKAVNKLGISSLPLNDDDVKSWFTKDELKRFKFWDNPAFEIKEVTE